MTELTPMGKMLANNIAKQLSEDNLRTLELQLTDDIVRELKNRITHPQSLHELETFAKEVHDEWHHFINR